MLRTIRIIIATVLFALITMLFLDFTGTLHTWFGWLAKIQFLPAALALNIGVILFLITLTLVCGRIYCSVICPLGVYQDIVSWISSKRKKNRFRYSSALSWLRYSILIIFILAIIGGINSFVVLLAPYSAYGRIVSNPFRRKRNYQCVRPGMPICSLQYTNGSTMDWHTWPNALIVTLSTKRMYG